MDDQRPPWWEKNAAYKQRLDIPEYQPPRFQDQTYTHTVVDELEDTYDCTIRFVGQNSTYLDDWQVHIDGRPVMEIGRHRDENGNTVYEIDSTEFEERLVELLTDADE